MTDKVLELSREAGIDAWWDSGNEMREVLDEHLSRFYTLCRADLEADNARLLSSYKSVMESHIAVLEANAKLKEHLRWALSNINCEPFEWGDEENTDAHEAARAALEKPND